MVQMIVKFTNDKQEGNDKEIYIFIIMNFICVRQSYNPHFHMCVQSCYSQFHMGASQERYAPADKKREEDFREVSTKVMLTCFALCFSLIKEPLCVQELRDCFGEVKQVLSMSLLLAPEYTENYTTCLWFLCHNIGKIFLTFFGPSKPVVNTSFLELIVES